MSKLAPIVMKILFIRLFGDKKIEMNSGRDVDVRRVVLLIVKDSDF